MVTIFSTKIPVTRVVVTTAIDSCIFIRGRYKYTMVDDVPCDNLEFHRTNQNCSIVFSGRTFSCEYTVTSNKTKEQKEQNKL